MPAAEGLGIWYSKLPHNPEAIRVGNPENSIMDDSGVLILDGDGKLKIIHSGEEREFIPIPARKSAEPDCQFTIYLKFWTETIEFDGSDGKISLKRIKEFSLIPPW